MIVADEIKDLASRTAGAVREISKIIREVREGSDSALEVVERGVRAVNEGVKRAELAGENSDDHHVEYHPQRSKRSPDLLGDGPSA